MISKPTRLKFDGVKQLQTSELERSPMFTPLGSPSAADQEDRIELLMESAEGNEDVAALQRG